MQLIALLAMASQVVPCAAAPPAKVPAIELQQIQQVGGAQKLVLAKTAMRYEHPNMGVIFFSRHPFEQVTIYNPTKKIFIEQKMKHVVRNVKGLSFLIETTGEFTDSEWQGPKPEKFLGLDALVYKKTTPNKSWCKFYVMKDKTWPEQMVKMICTHSALTESLGIPLRKQQMVTRDDSMFLKGDPRQPREVMNVFDTKSVKNIQVADSFFAPPPGCKRAKENREVVTNAVGFKSYKDMINTPDFLFQSSTKKLGGPADSSLNDPSKQKKRNRVLEEIMR